MKDRIDVMCAACNPILFQVFVSTYVYLCFEEYEPDYWALDFANKGYETFVAERKIIEEEDEKYEAKRKEAFEEYWDILCATPIDDGVIGT